MIARRKGEPLTWFSNMWSIEALTKKIEQQEENEYIAAVQDMMEKESNEQRT